MGLVPVKELAQCALALIALSIPAGTVSAQSVIATVPAANGEAVAVNPVTNKIYVANASANRVTVVDGVTHATTNVAVGRNPQYVAVNTAANKIYVSNTTDASLTIIDGATLSTITLVINGAGPIAVNESTNKIYVLRQGNNGEVTVVNGNTLSWYAIDTGSHTPAGLALNPATNRLYVSHNLSGDVRAIDITSPLDHPPNVSIQIAGHPTALALNASTNRIYVLSDDERGPIVAIDGSTNTAQPITAPGHAIGPRVVAVNPTSNKVYAGFSNEVVIVDAATRALTFVPTAAVVSIAVNATSNKAYVLDAARNLTVIDGGTNGTVTIPVGAESFSVAVNPNTNRAYVAGAVLTVIEGGSASPPPAPGINVEGLWWGSNGSESGWGINVTHQGDILFATWFTYDVDGRGQWLVMSNGARTATNTYVGALYRTTGPVFSSTPFDPAQVVRTQVGTAAFTFTDGNSGTLAATVDGVQIGKAISRQLYASPVPTCTLGGSAGALPNYQDLWWKSPAGSESGWGINITHQGDILFVTWFTYGSDGRGMWLVGSNISKNGNANYAGTLYRTTGPPIGASPWDPSRVVRTPVGSIDFTFTDANNGSMNYTLDGFVQSKAITRQVFASPTTVCR
jgi:YVTN family beta-propeller protein